MAKTYYKYAERDVNSQIDWSQVGKNLTDMLFDQAELRQNKRKELENASNDFGKVVSDMPTGISESWTNNTIDFANNVQEQRKLDDSLLAQGLMPLNMYLKKRELSKSSTEKFYGISKKMQAETAATVERIKSGTNMEREQRNLELIENLAVNGMPMLHDVTGELIVANMIDGPDGVKIIDPNKNNHMSVDQYDKLVTQKFDKYDFSSAAKTAADVLGDYVISSVDESDRAGGLNVIIKKSGAAINDKLKEYTDDFINTIAANPLHMESVLTDTMGKYKTTYDTDQAASDPNYILLVPDKNTGVAKAEFTEAQEKDFREFAKRQLYARVDEKLEIASAGTKPFDPTRSLWINRAFEKEDAEQQFALIASAMRGDKTAMQTLMTGYGGTGIAFDPDKKFMDITINGVVRPISLEGDLRVSGANLAAALGLSSEEYNAWAKKNNIPVTNVEITTLTEKFKDVRGVEQVGQIISSENVKALNRSLTMDFRDMEIDKQNVSDQAKSFARELQAIAGPLGISTSVDIQGNVTIGGDVIPKGINQADKVLELLDKKYKAKPQQTRKTVKQIMEEDPSLTREQAIAIFKELYQ